MPEIIIEEIANAPVDVVYATAKDIERFPEWMPDMESITVVSREGNKVVSKWVGRVDEFKRFLRWTEEDLWDDDKKTCVFRTLEGDWDKYEGEWNFISEGDQTRMRMRLDFEFNVPLIGPLIKGLLAKLVEKNSRGMLQALKTEAERAD